MPDIHSRHSVCVSLSPSSYLQDFRPQITLWLPLFIIRMLKEQHYERYDNKALRLISLSMCIEINVSPLSVVTTWVINRFHLALYHLTLGRKRLEDGRERNHLSETFCHKSLSSWVQWSRILLQLSASRMFMMKAFPLDSDAPERNEFQVSTSLLY